MAKAFGAGAAGGIAGSLAVEGGKKLLSNMGKPSLPQVVAMSPGMAAVAPGGVQATVHLGQAGAEMATVRDGQAGAELATGVVEAGSPRKTGVGVSFSWGSSSSTCQIPSLMIAVAAVGLAMANNV